MCVVQHLEMKSVFTFQPIKRLVSTTVKSAKPAVLLWIFLLRTENRQLRCLAVMVHIVWQERRVAATKKKNHLLFRRNFSANHSHPHQKRQNWVLMRNKLVRFLLVDDFRHIQFSNHFIQCQSTVNRSNLISQLTQIHHDLLSLQRRNPVDSRFWSRLCYYCSE